MKLSEIKEHLKTASAVNFMLPDGTFVPSHFHVTEIGQITKNFIDCGGTIRNEKVVNFQLWEDGDFDHRIAPQKLLSIIDLSEKALGLEDGEIEVEYQTNTIGKYGLFYNGKIFQLVNKKTACLASDKCGTSSQLAEVENQNTCKPGGGCC